MNSVKFNKFVQGLSNDLGLDTNKMLNLSYKLRGFVEQVAKSDVDAAGSFLFQGKPIYDSDSESALLARTILYPTKALTVCSSFTTEHFYTQKHQLIWEAIKYISESGKVSVDSICSYLANNDRIEEAGGRDYIKSLTIGILSDEGLNDFVDKVSNAYVIRKIANYCAQGVQKAYNTNLNEAGGFKNDIMALISSVVDVNTNLTSYANGQDMAKISSDRYEEIVKAKKEGMPIVGIPSLSIDLTWRLGGYQKGKLYISAGRPGMGKSAFALSEAWNMSKKYGIPSAFYSLEMPKSEFAERLFGIDTDLPNDDYKYGKMEIDDPILLKHLDRVHDSKIIVESISHLYVDVLADKIRLLVEKEGVKIVFIDYIQLMKGVKGRRYGNRELEVSDIARTLKMLAIELDIPIIALAQLNRSVETRGGSKRPILSDLRESGAIEQDADAVLFHYRPEYYKILEDDEGNSLIGVGEIIVAKNRGGSTDSVKCFYNSPSTKWDEYKNMPFDYVNPSVESDKEIYFKDQNRISIDDFQKFGFKDLPLDTVDQSTGEILIDATDEDLPF